MTSNLAEKVEILEFLGGLRSLSDDQYSNSQFQTIKGMFKQIYQAAYQLHYEREVQALLDDQGPQKAGFQQIRDQLKNIYNVTKTKFNINSKQIDKYMVDRGYTNQKNKLLTLAQQSLFFQDCGKINEIVAQDLQEEKQSQQLQGDEPGAQPLKLQKVVSQFSNISKKSQEKLDDLMKLMYGLPGAPTLKPVNLVLVKEKKIVIQTEVIEFITKYPDTIKYYVLSLVQEMIRSKRPGTEIPFATVVSYFNNLVFIDNPQYKEYFLTSDQLRAIIKIDQTIPLSQTEDSIRIPQHVNPKDIQNPAEFSQPRIAIQSEENPLFIFK